MPGFFCFSIIKAREDSQMTIRKLRTFPFLPKSNAHLMPGDFWSFQFGNDRYAAGRVVELPWQHQDGSDRRTFLAGLMDWSGHVRAVPDDLANRKMLDQGRMHVRAFSFSDWKVEGNRDLNSDYLEPWLFKTATYTQFVRKGLGAERLGTKDELRTCSVRGAWGMTFIVELAKMHFKGSD